MKAVFKWKNGAYKQVDWWEVNNSKPYLSDPDKKGKRSVVGIAFDLPETLPERVKFYLFSEGVKHNELTITDPREILNMRAWLDRRSKDPDNEIITEIYCDEEAKELTEDSLKGEEPVKSAPEPEEAPKERDTSDWDRKYSQMLTKR